MKNREKTIIIILLSLIILYLICKYVFPVMHIYIIMIMALVPALLSKLIGLSILVMIFWLIIKVLRK